MSELSEKGKLIKSYLKRFTRTSTHTLANKIFKENPLHFKDKESVRGLIRYHEGKSGNKCRENTTDRTFFDREKVSLMLPTSCCKPYKNYIMPKVNNRILGLFDLHIPFHDNDAIEIALQYGVEQEANTVLLGGDILDFYELSWFSHEPRIATFREEREKFWQFIDTVNYVMPNAKIFWLEGNHERRFEKYLMTKAPEIYDTEEFELPVLFHCAEHDIEYIGDKRIITAGKLRIIHGDEYGSGINTPVNPARNLFLKTKACSIEGHFHSTSEHTETDIDGKVITCWSIGCLCGLHPEYRPLNKWNQGFAFIEMKERGHFNIKNLRIVKGQVV